MIWTSTTKGLKQLINTQTCVQIIVKHRRLDHDIYVSFTRIVHLEIVYLVRKKLAIFKQVKIHALKSPAVLLKH